MRSVTQWMHRRTATELWFSAIVSAEVLTLVMAALVSQAMYGEVRSEYLIVGALISFFVSASVMGLLQGLLRELRALKVEAESQLRLHNAFLSAHQTLGEALAIVSLESGKFETASENLGELIGRPIGPTTGVYELLGSAERDQVSRWLDGDHDDEILETCIVRTDGRVGWFHLAQARLSNVEARVVVIREISAQRRLGARMRVLDRMATLGTVAAGVGHELSNPLTFVLGNLEIIRSELDELEERNDDLVDSVERALSGARRASDILRRLRTFTQSAEDLEPHPVSLHEIISTSVAMAKPQTRYKSSVEIDLPEDLPLVRGNESRLGQVFLNLVLNAAQALPTERPENRIAIRSQGKGTRVEVTVSDNGPGIPLGIQDSVFEPLFTTKAAAGGTGLGLSICKEIVESLGGTITVRSEVGEGATFLITLTRAASDEAGAVVSSASSPILNSIRPKLLVVDDEEDVCQMVVGLLSKRFEVVKALSVREALSVLHDEHIDLLLSDVVMPETSGIELYNQLLESNPSLAASMIFMTGGVLDPKVIGFLEGIDNQRIYKPFDAKQLRDVLEQRASGEVPKLQRGLSASAEASA